MPEADKQEVLAKLRRKLTERDTDNVRLHLRISGGMPGEQLQSQDVTLLGTRQVQARAEDTEGPPLEASSALDENQAYEVLRQLADGADDLVDRSEARFIPDSLVGAVTIEVEGDTTTLYFLADKEEQEAQRQFLSPATAEALDKLTALAARVLEEGGRRQ
jgi:hypothetical protein